MLNYVLSGHGQSDVADNDSLGIVRCGGLSLPTMSW